MKHNKVWALLFAFLLLAGLVQSAGAEGEKVSIRWVHEHSGISPYAAWINEYLLPTFEEQYGDTIDLEVEVIPGEDNMKEKMNLYLATDEMPEITPEGQYLSYQYAQVGVALDLTPFLEDDPEIRDGISVEGLAKNSYNGQIFGLPIQTTYFPMFYNSELFEKAGISENELPFATWDDFYAALDKLVAAGVEYPLAMETGDNAWCTSMFLSALIGSRSEEGYEFMNTMYPTDYNHDFIAEALDETVDLLKRYADPDAIGSIYAKTATRFFKEESAIMINGMWHLGDMDTSEETTDAFVGKIKTMNFPGNAAMKSAKYGSCIITEDPVKAEAAYKLLRTMATPEAQYQFMLYNGCLPDNTSVVMDAAIDEKFPELVSLYNNMKDADGFEAYSRSWLPAVCDELPNIYTGLYYGTMTSQEACEILTELAAE